MAPKDEHKITSEMKIKLTFESEEIAKSVNDSTAPENKEVPEGVIARAEVKGKEVYLFIRVENSIKDLLSTVEDYLEKIDLSSKTIEIIQKE